MSSIASSEPQNQKAVHTAKSGMSMNNTGDSSVRPPLASTESRIAIRPIDTMPWPTHA